MSDKNLYAVLILGHKISRSNFCPQLIQIVPETDMCE